MNRHLESFHLSVLLRKTNRRTCKRCNLYIKHAIVDDIKPQACFSLFSLSELDFYNVGYLGDEDSEKSGFIGSDLQGDSENSSIQRINLTQSNRMFRNHVSASDWSVQESLGNL